MQADFTKRRKNLLEQIDTDALVVISSAPEVIRNGTVHYPYRQRSHFYYLTGFDEPNAILLLTNATDKPKFILFCRETYESTINWSAPPIGLYKACLEYGADEAHAINEFDHYLSQYLTRCQAVYFLMQEDIRIRQQLYQYLQQPTYPVGSSPRWIDVSPYLDAMRTIKDKGEIACLRQAVSISAQAHQRVMRFCRPGIYEYEVAAELHHEFERQGCQAPAYESIVASGKNACILHYQQNRARLDEGNLLLVDAGCECQYYAADITRTFPINGKFNPIQKQLYEIVLQAQIAAIKAIQPGTTWDQLDTLVKHILIEGLIDLGLLSSTLSTEEKTSALQTFYPHRLGHHLGLDVHDSLGQTQDHMPLANGMVITVEPALYIPPNIQHIAPEWHGIGIRIEDNILVTENGCEVLSENIPKTIEEIEALMNN